MIDHQSKMESTPRKSLAPLIVYVLCFFTVWIGAWVYGTYPWAVRALGPATFQYALLSIGFRLATWVLPVFWYLRRIDGVDPWHYLRLREHWKRGVVVGVALGVINLAGTMIRIPPSGWHGPYITWNSILGSSILVGFVEEIPFRGFLLRKLEERFTFWPALVISSLLFLAIHIPGWLMLGAFSISNAVFVFVFGALMGIVLRYSKSLWAPIIAHSLNDFISVVLVHR
jgi:membrane protease YdiL (CAAX protease family)